MTEPVRLCSLAEIDGPMRQVVVPGREPLAVFRIDGAYYVTDDTCTHAKASLSDEGNLDGHTIECGWHMGRFDVRTGKALALPCSEPLRIYAVTIVGDALFADVG